MLSPIAPLQQGFESAGELVEARLAYKETEGGKDLVPGQKEQVGRDTESL